MNKNNHKVICYSVDDLEKLASGKLLGDEI